MEVSLTFAELMTAGRPLHSMTISLYMTSAASRPAHATRSPVPYKPLHIHIPALTSVQLSMVPLRHM